jgi:cell division protein ZapA (FtsZ GTPase activity inhibitor)
VAGVLLAAVSSVVALIAAIRLNRRVAALSESSFVTKLESLQIQAARLVRTDDDIQALERRVKAASESLRHTAETSGFYALAESWRDCATQVRAIVAELS